MFHSEGLKDVQHSMSITLLTFVQHCWNLKNPFPPTDIQDILENVTLLQFDLVQNDKQTFLVKYKLFCYIKYSSVPNWRGGQIVFFQNFHS